VHERIVRLRVEGGGGGGEAAPAHALEARDATEAASAKGDAVCSASTAAVRRTGRRRRARARACITRASACTAEEPKAREGPGCRCGTSCART